MRSLLKSIGFAVGIAVASAPAMAAVVVDFYSTGYVAASPAAPLSRLTSPPPTGVVFSDTVQMQPTAGYTIPAGKSGVFYGGFQLTGAGNRFPQTGGFDTSFRDKGADGDILQVRYNFTGSPNNLENQLAMLMFFDKANFLNDGSTASVALDSTSTFKIATGAENNADTNSVRQRIVIRQGSNYYIGKSNIAAQADGLGVATRNLATAHNILFTDITWKAYDPFTSIRMTDADFTAAATYTGPFDNITGIGAYVESSRAAAASGDLRTALRVLQVDALIPEPVSLSLLAGAALLAGRRRR